MSILVPDPNRQTLARRRAGRVPVAALGVRTGALGLPTLGERLLWAREHGFQGVEIGATGGPRDLYAPAESREARARLREQAAEFAAVAVEAPYQETLDVTLVSPSSSIRRASVTEIWSCLRLAEALGGGVVVVRTGTAPAGVDALRQQAHVAECLETLDRMAGDHGVRVAVLLADYFRRGASADDERLRLLDLLGLPHTGVAVDLALLPHAASPGDERGDALNGLIRRLGARLAHVRLSAAGTNTNALTTIAAALRETGFLGMTCLASHAAAGEDASAPAVLLRAKAAWEQRLESFAARA